MTTMLTVVLLSTLQLLAALSCGLAQESQASPIRYRPTITQAGDGGVCPLPSVTQEVRENVTEDIRSILRNINGTVSPSGCGGTGWRQVAFINMTDPTYSCPSAWQLTSYSKRTCGRIVGGSSCESVTFSTASQPYSKVCGRIVAYQTGATVAFYPYSQNPSRTLEDVYVDGISLTHGQAGSREHIWTFVGGLTENAAHSLPNEICACDSGSSTVVPSYIGTDYFCESGLNTPWDSQFVFRPDDPIWDGMGCSSTSTCCAFNSPPWFTKDLLESTSDNLEVRLCQEYGSNGNDTPIELLELYVK